jgi:hydrophobic/amphiphilic exporter-1 (mainly G- bacteria), HAE1 family
MHFADFFIRRPIFASVIALLIVLAGSICIPLLPLAQYPDIAPPRVSVSANYTGASAEVVESAVTTLLEQQINGIIQAKYITSTSGNDGTSSVNITFDLDRNVDLAAVDVQSRVASVEGRLPDEVKRTGISIQKSSSAFLLAIGIGDPEGRYSTQFLSNYADIYIKDALKRIKGVGDVQLFGERKYSMRLWLDPIKMARNGLTTDEVVTAVREQNVQVAAGQIGQPPTPDDQAYQISVRVQGRLRTPEEFGNLIVKTGTDGSIIPFRDVGRAELGAEDYQTVVRFRGRDALGIGVFQRPGSNALEVVKNIRAEMSRLEKKFPPGLKYEYAFDTTLAVSESIQEVLKTLTEAILLVVLTMFVFLQSWRSTVIPLITIPVSLIGTFACMMLLGFSINTLTLFGIVLATGLVVDDAIVVIENISRFMAAHKLNARDASSFAMKEVAGAVTAISLVLVAVFVPVAFFPGTVGQLYKQFALTIACSVSISAFIALTLTPALSSRWLKGEHEPKQHGFFGLFNRALDRVTNGYRWSLAQALRFKAITIGIFVAIIASTWVLFKMVPSSFVPNEDSGYFITIVQGPEGASLNYTTKVLKQIEAVLDKVPEIESTFGVGGFSFAGSKPSNGILFSNLRPWGERKHSDQQLDAVINKVRGPLMQITEATVIPFNPPPIEGLGAFGGFTFEIQDLNGTDIDQLAQVTSEMCKRANQQPELRGVFSGFAANSPQLLVDVDRNKAKTIGVPLNNIFQTLQTYLGSYYVNDIDIGTRVYRVYVQADAKYRSNPKDIDQFYVRTTNGALIPLSNVVSVRTVSAPQTISHYDLFRSTEISGSAAPGFSSGQAMAAMERLAKEVLPATMTFKWSGLSLEEVESGAKTFILFALGIIFVYLLLSAQYESFTDPLIILLSVPAALFGAMFAQYARGLQNDVFCQIGLVMLVGLVCKNAILIVEFANQLRDAGMPAESAVQRAAATRLRPILMTTFAFLMGILPLVLAEGAGANSRHSLGTAVCGGMVASSLLTLYIVPVIYVLKNRLFNKRQNAGEPEAASDKLSKKGAHGSEEAVAFRSSAD